MNPTTQAAKAETAATKTSLMDWLGHLLDAADAGAASTASAFKLVCGSVPEDSEELTYCLSRAKDLRQDLDDYGEDAWRHFFGSGETLAKDSSELEAEQQLQADAHEGVTSTTVKDGDSSEIVEQARTSDPDVVLEPSGTDGVPVEQRCSAGPECTAEKPLSCPPSDTVLECSTSSDDPDLVQQPDGAVVQDGDPPGTPVNDTSIDTASATSEISKIEDLPGAGGVTEAAEAAADDTPFLVKLAGKAVPALEVGDKVLGFAGLALGFVQVWQDWQNGDKGGALASDLEVGLGAGMTLFSVDIGGSVLGWIGVGSLAVFPPALVGAVITLVVVLVAGWLLESLFGDLFAPDIFIDNSTGQGQDLTLRLAPAGTQDVRPGWSGVPGVWQVTVAPSGGLEVAGQAASDLHYDLLGPAPFQRERGWLVPRQDLAAWAQTELPRYGFDPQAVAGFIATWASLGQGPGSLDIYPQDQSLVDRLEPLSVSAQGSAVSIRRVWFLISPASSATAPISPSISDPGHLGIDVQEWGVYLEPGADPATGQTS
ncbi:MAG: hypothetical protein WBA31_05295 [Candidatus Dormiibacterota bacterium]